eukprot:15485858-Alexandrium_andersonii.AAC.1
MSAPCRHINDKTRSIIIHMHTQSAHATATATASVTAPRTAPPTMGRGNMRSSRAGKTTLAVPKSIMARTALLVL